MACAVIDLITWNACVVAANTGVDTDVVVDAGVDLYGFDPVAISRAGVVIAGPANCTGDECPLLPPIVAKAAITVRDVRFRPRSTLFTTVDPDVQSCQDTFGALAGVCLRAGGTLERVHVPFVFGTSNAIALYGGAITIVDIEAIGYSGNRVVRMSGSPTLDVTFSGGVFEENSSGAIALNAGRLTIDGTRFIGNTSTSHGAAIQVGTGATAATVIRNATFSSNRADGQGGAVYVGSAGLTLSDSTFSDNVGGVSGGAVAVSGSVAVTLDRVAFTDNRIEGTNTTRDGGALALFGTATTLRAVDFASARTGQDALRGGFLYQDGGSLSWRGGTADGGAVGEAGGAVFLSNVNDRTSEPLVAGVEFTADPGVTAAGRGGFLALEGTTRGVVEHSAFLGGNASIEAAHVRLNTTGDVTLKRDLFCAAANRPSVQVVSSGGLAVTYDVFYGNAAGAITRPQDSFVRATSILQSTFVDNDLAAGTGQAALVLPSEAVVRNTIIVGTDGGLHTSGSFSPFGGNNLFWEWTDPATNTQMATATYWRDPARNNVYADPLFLDYAPRGSVSESDCRGADFHLDYLAGSPAIDAGFASTTAERDPDGSMPDLGAYGGLGSGFYVASEDGDADGVSTWLDCDDANSAVGAPDPWFVDDDQDGFGTPDTFLACGTPSDGALVDTDCDDTDGNVFPGAEETCDGVDEDCDTLVDEGEIGSLWYDDSDADGFGAGAGVRACVQPAEYVARDGDCAPGDPLVNPEAIEVCDGVDQDCDEAVDEGVKIEVYADADGDGFGDPQVSHRACAPGDGEVTDAQDCDDADGDVFPGATELTGDGIDQDCDGHERCFPDADGDGFRPDDVTGAVVSDDADCADAGEASGEAPLGDCDDADASRFPGAEEVAGDAIDQDCDGEDPALDTDTAVDTDTSGDTDTSADTALDTDTSGDTDVPLAPWWLEGGGCGCAAGGARAPGAALLVLGALARRRRAR